MTIEQDIGGQSQPPSISVSGVSATAQSIQVNLFQKHLFLHQLTHNMTIDCSLIVQYMKIARSEHVVSTDFFCFDIQNNLCTQHVLSLQFSCTELVIQ